MKEKTQEQTIKNLKVNRFSFLILGISFVILGISFQPILAMLGLLCLWATHKANKSYKTLSDDPKFSEWKLKQQEKSKTKQIKREEKQLKTEKSVQFFGEALQPIGKIPANGICTLTLKPEEKVLNIHHQTIDIILPYNRLRSFMVEDEVKLSKSGSGLGRALVGGALFGGAGAIVGQNTKKGKTDIKWIGTLTYVDKEGKQQQLSFLESGMLGVYKGENKNLSASKFEDTVNRIASEHGENLSEL